MTEQTNIEEIVKPLVWREPIPGFYKSESSFRIYKDTDDYKIHDNYGSVELYDDQFFTNFDDAANKVFEWHSKGVTGVFNRVAIHLDLTKLQPQPAPFWKPKLIAECPRQVGTLYMLFSRQYEPMLVKPKGKSVWSMVPLGQETSADGYTHFAEIPACEVQP